MYLSRLQLRRNPGPRALAFIHKNGLRHQGVDLQRRLIWSLFSSTHQMDRDFLWRAESNDIFLVLSARMPEDGWGLFTMETKPYTPQLQTGARLEFRLRANAVITRSRAKSHRRVDVVMHALYVAREQGASLERPRDRMGTAHTEGGKWLKAQGEKHGFALLTSYADDYEVITVPRRSASPARFGLMELGGLLRVTDPDLFLQAHYAGFGRAKAFGCGLMLLRRR